MTRDELIAALETATEPSDALDLAVTEWCFENGAVGGVNYDPQLWIIRNGGEFTSSIDAALTLVPDGWEWCVYGAGGSDVWQPEGLHAQQMTYAATPAIALCIAALKARPK